MTTFNTLATDIGELVNESKADQIAELLLKGVLTKAQIAKAVGANYSQVHSKEKDLLSKGLLTSHAPLGKKGKIAQASKPTPNKQSSQRKQSAAKVVKPVVKSRPAGTPTEKKSPIQAKIDEMILHMVAVIDNPTAVDLITAATDAVPESVKDTMTSADLNEMIRDRLKSLIRNGELFQSTAGIITTSEGSDEIDDSNVDSDDEANILRKRREDDAVFGGDDDDDNWLGDMLGQGRRTGGYHL